MRIYLVVCLMTSALASLPWSPASAQSLADLQGIFELPFDGSSYQPTLNELKDIESLIDSLKEIDSIYVFEELDTLNCTRFVPAAQNENSGLALFGFDEQVDTHPTILALVKYGPKAMPALLRHLDDASPTKTAIESERPGGSLWFCCNFSTEDQNPFDALVADMEPKLRMNSEESRKKKIRQYTLTVGDFCFAILGHIVNRSYIPIPFSHYSHSQVIESPAHDSDMASAIRKIWQCEDPAKRLFQSLYCDYIARNSLGNTNAALRLLCYFPLETSPRFIKELLQTPKLDQDGRWEDYDKLESIAFLSSVDEPQFTDALVDFIVPSRENDLVLGCINPVILARHQSRIFDRMRQQLFDQSASDEVAPYEANWLRVAAKFFPTEAESTFNEYLHTKSKGDVAMEIIVALSGLQPSPPWAVEILKPYLNTKQVAEFVIEFHDLDVLKHEGDPRVCDWAAQVVAGYIPGATFYLEGTQDYRDRQIANIQARLDGNPTTPLREEYAVDLEKLPHLQPDKVVAINRAGVYPTKCSTGDTLFTCAGNLDVVTGQFTVREMQSSLRTRGASLGCKFNGRQIYFDPKDEGAFKEYDLLTGALLRRVTTAFTKDDEDKGPNAINDFVLIGDGEAVMVATKDGVVHLLQLDSQKLETIYKTRGSVDVSLLERV